MKTIVSLLLVAAAFSFVFFFLFENESQNSVINTLHEIPAHKSPKDETPEAISTETDSSRRDFSWQDIANGRVSIYPPGTEGVGAGASIYPLDPANEYFKYIDSAKAGNSFAQYRLARALKECYGLGGPERIQELELKNEVPEWEIKMIQLRAARCMGLTQELSNEHLNEWATHADWRNRAAKNNVVAKAWLMSSDEQFLQSDQACQLWFDALISPDNDDLFVFSFGVSYLSHGGADDDILSAWQVAQCRLHPYCDMEIMKTYVHYYERQSGYAFIMEESEKIANAFSQKQYKELRAYCQ